MRESREQNMLPWVIIGGIIVAWILARVLSGKNSNANSAAFTGTTDQRGTFGTDTGLYGSAVAGATLSGD